MSNSALTYGVEWNLAVQAHVAPVTFEEAQAKLMHLFYHEQTVPLNLETCQYYKKEYEDYHRQNPSLAKTWSETEEIELTMPLVSYENLEVKKPLAVKETQSPYRTITPRPAQQSALEELEKTWGEGYDKAMVVMATGLGKTYLAAFFEKELPESSLCCP